MSEQFEQSTHESRYEIFINGERKVVDKALLTYEEVVYLAFPSHDPQNIYSVSFERAEEPREGELVAGQEVQIKNGTQFDVTLTGKS